METKTIQKLEKATTNPFELAQQYYGLLSSLNNLQLTEREIQLIAFCAIRGSVSYATVRKEFCDRYDSSFATIANMLTRLKRLGVFVKQGKLTIVNPVIVLDFSKPLQLEFTLTLNRENGKTINNASEGLSGEEVKSEAYNS